VAWLFSLLAPALTVFAAIVSPNPFSLASAVAACGLVALIFPYSVGFFRGATSGPESTQLLVVVAALLSLLSGMAGARWLGDQFKPPIHGWTQALYFTVTTISTNGSEYAPQSDTAAAFVVVLILLGVGTFLSAVVVLFLPFLERRLQRIAQRLERAQMEDLSDHVVICGASAAARATAASLREDGVRSIILSPNSEAVDLLRGEGEAAHLGEPSNEDDLRAVGIDRARALVAADDSDAENLLTVITARGILAGLRIVAVATSPASLAKLRRAGANEAISAVAVAAKLVSAAVLEPVDSAAPHSHTISH
jgi:voltage-gated potassium channel